MKKVLSSNFYLKDMTFVMDSAQSAIKISNAVLSNCKNRSEIFRNFPTKQYSIEVCNGGTFDITTLTEYPVRVEMSVFVQFSYHYYGEVTTAKFVHMFALTCLILNCVETLV